jgi:hypothetical protein
LSASGASNAITVQHRDDGGADRPVLCFQIGDAIGGLAQQHRHILIAPAGAGDMAQARDEIAAVVIHR